MSRSGMVTSIAAAAAVGAVAVAVRVDHAGAPELLFGTVVVLSLLAVVRLAARAGRRAAGERARAQRLAATEPADVAERAVTVERARLGADIQAVLLAAATAMGSAAERAARNWAGDPAPALHAVQRHGQRAGVELRRLLGLLREAGEVEPIRQAAPPVSARVTRGDLLLAAGVTALALLEHVAYRPGLPVGAMNSWISAPLTACAAASIAFRRAAPGLGAAACGLVFVVSIWTGVISGGFWFLATAGSLAWGAAAGRRRAGDLLGLAALWGGVAAGGAVRDPKNVLFDLLVLAAATLGGAAVGASDAWGRSARQRADRRAAELAFAAEAAVSNERLAVARELHDVVSHAVGVMVMQAGAALATRETDEARARRALELVRRTAADSLGELDQLLDVIGGGALGVPAAGPVRHDVDALTALVDRMRRAGVDVELQVTGAPEGEAAAVGYRVVQESLTNVVRHATGATVVVRVHAQPAGVTIDVADDGPGPGPESRRGYGLVGIAERVQRLGGEFSAGARPDGRGFHVAARLPALVRSPP